MKKFVFISVTLLTICSAAAAAWAQFGVPESVSEVMEHDDIVAVGEKVYQTPGQQTCLKCHQAEGQGEGWAGAADLRKPYTWSSFKALGGYEALEENRDEFLLKLHTVLYYLVQNGGIRWNTQFVKEHPEVELDWSLTDGKSQYDMMMWGTAQKEMKDKIAIVQAELAEEGIEIDEEAMANFAVYAVFEYVKAFEEVNEDDDTLPLVFSKE